MDTIIDIEAARALNAARVQLEAINAGPIYARPFYVRDRYTSPVKDLLAGALTTLCGDEDRAQQLYDQLLDGADVAEALAEIRKGWIAAEFGDALTFRKMEGRNGFSSDDGVSLYMMWYINTSAGDQWTLRTSDVNDADSPQILHELPNRWTAELVASARSNSQGWYHEDKAALTEARGWALAAIEKHKCHGCARDAHGKGHISKCPQATDISDRTGTAAKGAKA